MFLFGSDNSFAEWMLLTSRRKLLKGRLQAPLMNWRNFGPNALFVPFTCTPSIRYTANINLQDVQAENDKITAAIDSLVNDMAGILG